jgi:transposase-like protein
MPRKVSDERKRFWRDLVERQPTSGLNIARFCADAGISQNAFYVWRKRLLKTPQQDRAAMARRNHRRKKAVAKSLVPVRVIPDVSHQPPTAKAIEIAWPNGLVLRIPSGCDSQTLREVIGLLSSAMDGETTLC